MRTKTLLLSAVALAAGLVAAQAQSNVYSANVVGYINFPLVTGYNMIAPGQMDLDGTGTNNSVVNVFGTNLPANTAVLAWVASQQTYTSATWVNSKGVFKWTGNTNGINAALEVGQGVFVQSPSSTTLTCVGNVVQGTNIVPMVAGYQILSSAAPLSGSINTNLNYQASVGDVVLPWDPVGQGFTSSYSYIANKGNPKWSPSVPQISPGQAVFLQTSTTTDWTNNFVVH